MLKLLVYLALLPALLLTDLSAEALSCPAAPKFAARGKSYPVLSHNWAGYAVTAAKGKVADARSSWIVPALNCPSGVNSYSAVWVGIDGYKSRTVEQLGTAADCNAGQASYYAWYEFYPRPAYVIHPFDLKPGDRVSARVQYLGSRLFKISMANLTSGRRFSKIRAFNAERSSAEWIVEAPFQADVLPLADFNTAYLGSSYTGVASTNYARVGTKTAPIGKFGTALKRLRMIDRNGRVKARESDLAANGSSFLVEHLLTEP